MKSVGEVMAMGRTFQESFQKALRGLETGIDGLTERSTDREEIVEEIGEPGPERILFVGDAFRLGMTLDEIHEETAIDPWFLAQIEQIIQAEKALDGRVLDSLSRDEMFFLKKKGFSDRAWPSCWARTSTRCGPSAMRWACARSTSAWTPAPASSPRRRPTCTPPTTRSARPIPTKKKIMVLGGGPNRIGQGIEFDYCCVHAALAMREDGYETIMVNCNPETVSTDYDTSDRLYFEPLTLEDVLEIVDKEKPTGVIVQYGGQTPLKLALDLERAGVPIIGTSPDMIDAAEDRERFQKLLHPGPEAAAQPHRAHRRGRAAAGQGDRLPAGGAPSYVLGGRAMEIVHGDKDLERYMREAVQVSEKSPCCWTASWTTPSRSTSTASPTASPS
jgi:carbamoyl-phosphate synthase large subunit